MVLAGKGGWQLPSESRCLDGVLPAMWAGRPALGLLPGLHHLPAPGRERAAARALPTWARGAHPTERAKGGRKLRGPTAQKTWRRGAGPCTRLCQPGWEGLLGPGPSPAPGPHLSCHTDRPGKRLPGGRQSWEQQDGVPSQPSGRSPARHPLAVPAAETGRGERPTQNSPGGRAAAPPAPSLPPAESGCHFETSRLCPRGQAPRDSQQMGGRRRHAVPGPTPARKAPSLSQGPTATRGEGPHPPHRPASMLLRGPPPPETPQTRLPGHHTCSGGRLAWGKHRPTVSAKVQLSAPPTPHPPQPHSPAGPLAPSQGSASPSQPSGPEGVREARQARSSRPPAGQQHVGCLTTSTSPHPSSSHHLPWD